MPPTPIPIAYVTSSRFKLEENEIFVRKCTLADGTSVPAVVDLQVRSLQIPELLEVDLRVMVQAEVTSAYQQLKVPCIVEHAGLVFDDYAADSYPGGLTKPMWNTLGDQFIEETKSAGRGAVARAVVAYCDGLSVETFVGETHGSLADAPRGARAFYWDTIFVPDDAVTPGRTYAELVEDPSLGLEYKVVALSQSTKAKLAFVEHLRKVGRSKLWA
jgi:XTP/dITP diphosphohydrolase